MIKIYTAQVNYPKLGKLVSAPYWKMSQAVQDRSPHTALNYSLQMEDFWLNSFYITPTQLIMPKSGQLPQ